MKKIAMVMMVILLVFSELNVYVADTSVGYENPTAECQEQSESVSVEESANACEEQPKSESEENLATEGEQKPEAGNEENPVTEGEQQPESGNEENPATEGEEQPESGSEENPATEGEEQPESGSEEKPATEGEEQPESEKEENLAPACEQQPAFGSEEKPATEGEEQPVPEGEENQEIECVEEPESAENLEIACAEGEYLVSEEELAIEGEEQLEFNSEEELVTEGKEQEGLDIKEKLAPKCRRANRGTNIPISSVGRIGNIDFSKLDENDPIDGFTQIYTNEGLELPTQDAKGRKYYMYFGDLYNGRSVGSLDKNNQYSYIQHNDDWLRPLPSMNDTLENVVNNSKYVNASYMQIATALNISSYLPEGVASYYYFEGRASADKRGNGLTIANGSNENASAAFQTTQMPILKLYKNEKTHELIAYAAVVFVGVGYEYLQGYIKIKMSPVGNMGRVNINIKYLKKEDVYPYTNLAYSAHLDIAKRHEKSRMYSLGDHKGMYLHEKGMRDGQDYVLYFFRDGYANSPAAFRANDDPNNTSAFNNIGTFLKLNTTGIKDPGKDVMYPYTVHPGWAFRWEPMLQLPNTVREENLQIAVTDKLDPPEPPVELVPPVIKLDNNGKYTDNGYRISGTWKDADSDTVILFYEINDFTFRGQIGEYKNPNLNTNVPWEFIIPINQVEKGLDHKLTVYAFDGTDISNFETKKIRPELSVEEQVFGEDGNVPTDVAPGEILSYKILVDSGYISKDKGTYDQLTITQKYDSHLEPPTDLKVMDVNGRKVGAATYNVSTNTVEAKIDSGLPRSTKVNVTFNAKVKEDAPDEYFVVSQATAAGKYSTGDTVNKTSNEVKIKISGVLKFISAPQEIGFGEVLKISPRNKTYHLIQVDKPLAVKDTRALSRKPSWTMKAKLIQPLTGSKTGSKLEGLQYSYGENISLLTENASAEIYTKETTNKEVVDISKTWPDGDGIYLEVAAGTAKAEAYTGTIQWVLENVPMNE